MEKKIKRVDLMKLSVPRALGKDKIIDEYAKIQKSILKEMRKENPDWDFINKENEKADNLLKK